MPKLEKRKRILICYLNPYILESIVLPLIEDLGRTYSIDLITTTICTTKNLRPKLERLANQGSLSSFIIVPEFWDPPSLKRIIRRHWFIQKHILPLGDRDYALALFSSSVSFLERYVLNMLDKNKTILVGHHPFYSIRPIGNSREATLAVVNNLPLDNLSAKLGAIQGISKVAIFLAALQNGQLEKILPWALHGFRSRLANMLDCVVFPYIFCRKIFHEGKLDFTGLDSDSFQHIIVSSILSQTFCRNIYPLKQVHLSIPAYAVPERLVKEQPAADKRVLLLLGWYMGEEAVDKLLLRDLLSVRKETDCAEIHLKPHPSYTGNYLDKLKQYLEDHGLTIMLLINVGTVLEIVENYMGVVGFASHALIEARYASRTKFVVCLAGPTEAGGVSHFMDAKLQLGHGDGGEKFIDFIEADGSYEPSIFQKNNHPLPPYDSETTVLTRLLENETDK